jgi:hypothetical protein
MHEQIWSKLAQIRAQTVKIAIWGKTTALGQIPMMIHPRSPKIPPRDRLLRQALRVRQAICLDLTRANPRRPRRRLLRCPKRRLLSVSTRVALQLHRLGPHGPRQHLVDQAALFLRVAGQSVALPLVTGQSLAHHVARRGALLHHDPLHRRSSSRGSQGQDLLRMMLLQPSLCIAPGNKLENASQRGTRTVQFATVSLAFLKNLLRYKLH